MSALCFFLLFLLLMEGVRVACEEVFSCNYKTTEGVCVYECEEVHTLIEGFAPGCCFLSLGNEEYLSSISYAKFTQDSPQWAQQIGFVVWKQLLMAVHYETKPVNLTFRIHHQQSWIFPSSVVIELKKLGCFNRGIIPWWNSEGMCGVPDWQWNDNGCSGHGN